MDAERERVRGADPIRVRHGDRNVECAYFGGRAGKLRISGVDPELGSGRTLSQKHPVRESARLPRERRPSTSRHAYPPGAVRADSATTRRWVESWQRRWIAEHGNGDALCREHVVGVSDREREGP